MGRRIRWFGLAMVICFSALLLQLDNIQGIQAKKYQGESNNPITIQDEYAKPRGRIVSSDGVTVAKSIPTPNNPYYKYEREYPTGGLFAQIVGFTSYKYGTTTGIEAEYDKQLTFRTQPFRNLKDLLTTEQGTDTIVLTVNDTLQKLAQQALGGKDGAVVVLDPSNGNVLAMYSNPTFDPNALASPNSSTESNEWTNVYNHQTSFGMDNGYPMALYGLPPGSTFKVITSAAAYDHDPSLTTKQYPLQSSFVVPGSGGRLLHNASDEVCGGTFQEMLPESCDTGYAQVGLDLGAPFLVEEADAFGFGAEPPIDLPTSTYAESTLGESAIELEENQPYLAYSAIGQLNVRATPLEMAMVASAIADDGVIMKPHLMLRILDPNLNVVQSYQPAKWVTATSPQTAASISQLMQGVVTNPKGTAYGIFPSSWDVAAKTGTAQTGQGNTSTTDWMIAFAPASHPKVAIAVVVPDQPQSASGAAVSGPILRQVLQGILGNS